MQGELNYQEEHDEELSMDNVGNMDGWKEFRRWMGCVKPQAICAALLVLSAPAFGQETEAPSDIEIVPDELEFAPDAELLDEERRLYRLPGQTIIGSPEAVRHLPGSGHFINEEEIRQQAYADINRVLRQAPGVYLREEDGYGLFPNISIRGADPGRSSKTTLMEDGIMIAPAPYSAPSAYFSPSVERMSGLEVLKGSSQVRYGPHVTGGVVNYISEPIPDDPTGYLRFLYGTNDEMRARLFWGDTLDFDEYGRFGYLLEGYFRQTDGFREFDTTPDFRGGDSGFRNIEPNLKLMWEPNTDLYQRFEYKFTYTDRNADETYLGLATEDFRRNAQRRYSASRFDNITSDHMQTYLRHFIEASPDLDFTTTLYYTEFNRNWYKLNDIRDVGGIAGNNMSLSGALAGADGGRGLEVLRGNEEGILNVRANNREYYSWGAESVARYRFDAGWAEHELSIGLRYHFDQERRFQWEDRFHQLADGTIASVQPGIPGAQDNRVGKTDAIALFIQDEIDFGQLTITPGIRYEHLQQRFVDNRPGRDPRGSGDLNMIGGGVGATYDLDDEWTLFGGVHRGFSPPAPQSAIQQGLREESSIATELGTRYDMANGAFSAELAGFFTYFDDLLVRESIGAGGQIDESAGRVDVYGLELRMLFDPGIAYGWSFNNPYYATYTFTQAKLRSDTPSSHAESIFAGGQRGNRVPYIPENQFTLGAGLEFEKFGVHINGIYVDSTFTSASNTRNEIDPFGNQDARFGMTDSYFTVDVAAHYWLADQAKLFGGAQNLFDRDYIAARHPHGARSGQPLFAYIGMEVTF